MIGSEAQINLHIQLIRTTLIQIGGWEFQLLSGMNRRDCMYSEFLAQAAASRGTHVEIIESPWV